jgi:hypothetical protein
VEDILHVIAVPGATLDIEALSNDLENSLEEDEVSAIFAIIDRATGKAEVLRSELKKVSQ